MTEETAEEFVQIIEPTEEIFKKADYYTELVKKIIPDATVTLIGSLAVPVCIKNEIDLLVEIDENENIEKVQEQLTDQSIGVFNTGLIVDGEGFNRSKKKHGLICELHILHRGDSRIEKYLTQVEQFKSNPELTKAYADLKKSLDGSSTSDYKEAKAKFFEEHDLKIE